MMILGKRQDEFGLLQEGLKRQKTQADAHAPSNVDPLLVDNAIPLKSNENYVSTSGWKDQERAGVDRGRTFEGVPDEGANVYDAGETRALPIPDEQQVGSVAWLQLRGIPVLELMVGIQATPQ